MGQYYMGVLARPRSDGFPPVPVAFEQEEPGGLKLMEHAWVGNSYCGWFCQMIHHDPHHVAWVGDYSYDADRPCPEDVFKAAWGGEPLGYSPNIDFNLDGTFLVNHTEKRYLNLGAYYQRVLNGKDPEENWVPHPLPLLTAFGNGMGGGDYRGINEDQVGIWAWDILSIEDQAPSGFSEYIVDFN